MSQLHYADPIDAPDDDERRVAPRIKTLKRGKVMFNNMSSTFDCIVRNISSTGALLTLDEQAHLPREFDIRIGEEKASRSAKLVYRRGMLAGIHFLDAPPIAETPAEPATARKDPAPVSAAAQGDATVPGVRRLQGERLPKAITGAFRWF